MVVTVVEGERGGKRGGGRGEKEKNWQECGETRPSHTAAAAAAAAAVAAKSLQSCPTLCDPINGSPPGSSVPGILQARIPKWLPFPSPEM